MRISDWSSDVCSSDLHDRRRLGGGRQLQPAGQAEHERGSPQHREDEPLGPRGARQRTAPVEERRRQEDRARSEEHTSELQSLMRNSYAVFCLKKKIYNKK